VQFVIGLFLSYWSFFNLTCITTIYQALKKFMSASFFSIFSHPKKAINKPLQNRIPAISTRVFQLLNYGGRGGFRTHDFYRVNFVTYFFYGYT